jgi:hypothetical protein
MSMTEGLFKSKKLNVNIAKNRRILKAKPIFGITILSGVEREMRKRMK